METATASLCPDPEALAAFVDQGLRADEARQLEAHLAECDNCRLIVARVVDTQSAVLTADARTATPGRPGSSRRVLPFSRAHMVWGAGSLLAAAAVLTMMLNVGNRSMLAELAAAVGEERTVEARLSGFRYGPVRAPVRSGGSSAAASDNWTLYAAAGKIRETAERDPSAPNLHALGVAHLVLGHYDEAVRAIEDAIAEEPEPPQYHSDLAAAYLARAKHLDRPDDLPRALGAAERAIKGNESLLEARFNRALALEALYLEDQARQAWEDYLARDSASGWAADARTHLQTLQQRVAPRDGARNNSPPPITDTTVEAALDWLLRQGLPAWADAVLAGDSEQAAIQSSRLISYTTQITEKNSDSFPAALGALIASANSQILATAIREFAAARLLLESDRAAQFQPRMISACIQRLDPLAALCHLEIARYQLLRRRDDAARSSLQALDKLAVGSAYLEGRQLSILSYQAMVRPDYAAAIERFRGAYERLSSAKYLRLAGIDATQIADLFDVLGFSGQAWSWRLRALELSAAVDDPDVEYFSHLSTAESLVRSRNPRAAAAFMASFDAASEGIPALRRARLEISRSRMALAAGDFDTAGASFARADAIVTRSQDFRLQAMKADLLMVRAELERRQGQLESARTTLQQAMNAMGTERTPHRVLALLSHANISAQRPEWHSAFERSLADALRLISSRASDAVLPARQDDVLAAFETASSLIASDPVLHGVKGLHLIEQLREVLEGVTAARAIWQLSDFERLLSTVGEDTALVVFAFAEQSMLRWVVSGEKVEFIERRVSPAQVVALANTLTVYVNRNPEREDLWRQPLAELFQLLLADLPGVRDASELIIVPDGPLHRVPFGGLFDLSSQQYLFERTAVRVASNIASALGGATTPPGRPHPLNALVVGDPQLTGPQAGTFPRLLDARNEANEVANLYEKRTIMLGRDATKDRVLDSMKSADVIHFAGHAFASPSVPNPRLLLAGDPMNAADAVSAADLSGRVKDSTTVILAACETGATRFDQATSVMSISSAFLRAGARSVVATLWPIDDTSGAAFFPAIHRELLDGRGTAVAVARAQRACRRDARCRASAPTWIGTTVYGHN